MSSSLVRAVMFFVADQHAAAHWYRDVLLPGAEVQHEDGCWHV